MNFDEVFNSYTYATKALALKFRQDMIKHPNDRAERRFISEKKGQYHGLRRKPTEEDIQEDSLEDDYGKS